MHTGLTAVCGGTPPGTVCACDFCHISGESELRGFCECVLLLCCEDANVFCRAKRKQSGRDSSVLRQGITTALRHLPASVHAGSLHQHACSLASICSCPGGLDLCIRTIPKESHATSARKIDRRFSYVRYPNKRREPCHIAHKDRIGGAGNYTTAGAPPTGHCQLHMHIQKAQCCMSHGTTRPVNGVEYML